MVRNSDGSGKWLGRWCVGSLSLCRDLLARAREQSTVTFIKVKGHLHEELAKVGITDDDLAPGETYKDLGNVRADELATRAMRSGEHSGFTLR